MGNNDVVDLIRRYGIDPRRIIACRWVFLGSQVREKYTGVRRELKLKQGWLSSQDKGGVQSSLLQAISSIACSPLTL